MPGIKRKAASAVAATNGAVSHKAIKASPSKKTRAAPPPSHTSESGSDEDVSDDGASHDDFDDGDDLMLAAMGTNGGKARAVELMSDEDMEGGFVDLEQAGMDEDEDGEVSEGSDQSESEGNEELEGDGAAAKRKPAALYALPTNDEVQGLRETGELFKNNVFKLQVEELIPEVKLPYSNATALELVLRRLHSLFDSLKPITASQLGDATRTLQKSYGKNLQIPFPDPAPKEDAAYKFSFVKPSASHLVGSWPLRTAAKRPDGSDVDVAVIMPSEILQEKDHMNFRYFHKRAFYVAALAGAIANAKAPHVLGVDVSYELLENDPRRVILVLTPRKDKSETDFTKTKVTIRIHVAHEHGLFPVGRLAPSRNSVRIGSGEDQAQLPTPRYNAAVLSDSLHLAHLVYLHSTAEACPSFFDASLMLKTWAFQRGFGTGSRSHKRDGARSTRRLVFGTSSARFLLTMIMAHLLHGDEKDPSKKRAQRPKLSNGFSSYQLFRGVLDWLSTHDFTKQPVFMKAAPSAGLPGCGDKISRDDFAAHFDRVLVDPSGSLNLLAFMPPSSLDRLQYEARRSFAMLNDAEESHFDTLFLQDLTAPALTFDEAASVPLSSGLAQDSASEQIQRADWGTRVHSTASQILSVAGRALGPRAFNISLLVDTDQAGGGPWAVTAGRPSRTQQAELCILLDPEHSLRIVEYGPPPESTDAAAAFKTFWGDVVELRRFKDGRILESILWDVNGPAERWEIPRRILHHVFARHFNISAESIRFHANGFKGLLDVHSSLDKHIYHIAPASKGFQSVQSAFDTLARELRSLEDLPLSLISIVPSSPGLRGTSTFVPGPLNLSALGRRTPDAASYLPVLDIVLTFESSGRWPDDVHAIQAMKTAFYEKMARSIEGHISGAQCHCSFDAAVVDTELQDAAALEILLPTGFAFRARIHHERERVLLERIVADKIGEPQSRRRRARTALGRYDAHFTTAIRHHSAVAAAVHRFPALGETIRLTKRWLASHMLSNDFNDEQVELLCLSVFVLPGTRPPMSGPAGFSSTLRLLASWRWKEEPLVVPAQTTITAPEGAASTAGVRFPTETRAQVDAAFKAARSSDPAMSSRAWFIATEDDVHGRAWGVDTPKAATADAVRRLAKSMCEKLKSREIFGAHEIKAFFTPSLSHFDFVIHLIPSVLPRYAENVNADPAVWKTGKEATFRNLADPDDATASTFGTSPRVNFDPAAEFVQMLTSLYADSFRLYHDVNGGTAIGGLWNPSLSRPRPFKVALGFNSACIRDQEMNGNGDAKKGKEKEVQISQAREAVLAEVGRLGSGLVMSIRENKE